MEIPLIKLVLNNPDRILIRCNRCFMPRKQKEMAMRKLPGKDERVFKGTCKYCEVIRVQKYQKKAG